MFSKHCILPVILLFKNIQSLIVIYFNNNKKIALKAPVTKDLFLTLFSDRAFFPIHSCVTLQPPQPPPLLPCGFLCLCCCGFEQLLLLTVLPTLLQICFFQEV